MDSSHLHFEKSQEIESENIPDHVKRALQIASWFPSGGRVEIDVDDSLGIPRKSITEVEKLSGRYTDPSRSSVPMKIVIGRSKGTEEASIKIVRHSATEGRDFTIINLRMNMYEGSANMHTDYHNSDVVLQTLDPFLEQLAPTVIKGVKNWESQTGKRNRILVRSYYTTHDPEIYWLQMDSLFAGKNPETNDNPHRRVYLNLKFDTIRGYYQFINDFVEWTREFDKFPLSYKFLFSGKNVTGEILDPSTTKIVFYIATSQSQSKMRAGILGNHLAQAEFMKKQMVGELKQKARVGEGGQILAGGRVLIAKGTKEDRMRVDDRIEAGIAGTKTKMLADKLSVRYVDGR